MKKTTLLVLTTLLFACNQQVEKKKTDTPHVPVIKNGLKLAYYYQDSLKTGFEFYKKSDSSVTKKQLQFQAELEKRQKSLQEFLLTNDERAKSGQLSGFELQNIQQEAQRKEQALYQYQQNEGTKIEKETMEQLEVITKKIENAGKEFCKKNQIDVLLVHGSGGQINYIDPKMNVTKEFVNFLNEYQAKIEKDAGLKK
ncbi:MAG: OmpH family outer membrane protein [Flavobacteriia bacterium]|nr:OmpH family outer membrane protein [Flavobacteriia bacterium]